MSLSAEDIENIAKRLETGGASVSIQDPRVNRIQSWAFATIGACAVGAIVWVGTNISGLRETVVKLVTQNEFILNELNDQRARIGDLEKRNGSH